MNWSVGWPRTRPNCDRWQEQTLSIEPDNPKGVIDIYRTTLSAGPDVSPDELFDRAAIRLYRYEIFPSNLMHAHVCSQDGLVERGATIVQRVRIAAVVLETAVRVIDVWRYSASTSQEAGFAYATVEGHPEKGVSSFRVVKVGDSVEFEIRAISRPGSVVLASVHPVARWFQRFATRKALEYFALTAKIIDA